MLEIALNIILGWVGLPYLWGGENPLTGFDCSGLACEYLKMLGLLKFKEDLTAALLYEKFPHIEKPERGCLVYWKDDAGHVCHVGIMLNDTQFIAAEGGDHTTVDVVTAKKQSACIKVRCLSYRKGQAFFNSPLQGGSL